MAGIANSARTGSDWGFAKCDVWVTMVDLVLFFACRIPDALVFSGFWKTRVFRGFSISAKFGDLLQNPVGRGVNCKKRDTAFTKHPGPGEVFSKLYMVRRVEGFVNGTFGSYRTRFGSVFKNYRFWGPEFAISHRANACCSTNRAEMRGLSDHTRLSQPFVICCPFCAVMGIVWFLQNCSFCGKTAKLQKNSYRRCFG